jgi:excinuclease ABC subunit C
MEDQPTPIGRDLIAAKVKTLPSAPGVYRMLDANATVLYVGKAKNLKNRVASYTRARGHSNRIQRMIGLTRDMEFTRTPTETDALLLEANLIKKLKPQFNILLRDDKSFPYILLADDHAVPQLTKHRGQHRRPGHYFGPFASASAVNRAMKTLQRAFLLRSCSDSVLESRQRPCLLYQIKRCSAPCTNEIEANDYGQLVQEARAFLSGKSRDIQNNLLEKMQQASAALDFEAAAEARDRIRALTYIQSDNNIQSDDIANADVMAVTKQAGQVCIQVFFFRAYQNLGNNAFFPRHDRDAAPEDVLEAFMGQFYDQRAVPELILVNCKLANAKLLTEALSLAADHRVNLVHPIRGSRAKLVGVATKNAEEAIARHLAEAASQQKILVALAEAFDLDAPPQRIEIYDNSHLQGTNQIGGMVVAGPDGFIKNQYRKFNMRDPETAPGDDYGMMREMFHRRFSRLLREIERDPSKRPDLVIIDGGRGQLNVTAEVMDLLDLSDIPLVGIAKGPDRNAGREKFFMRQRAEFMLPDNSPVLYYLQRLRDEAHRFAIGSHRARRRKDIRGNSLDDIPGIGATRKRALLHHFGSAAAVRRASRQDLEKVEGINARIAQRIYEYIHGDTLLS